MPRRVQLIALVLVAVGCGSTPSGETTDELPAADAAAETTTEDVNSVADALADVATEPADVTVDAAADAQTDDAAPADADPTTTITSCAGRCFLLLTDSGNPCSCNPSCLDKGNCCADFQAVCTCKSDLDCDDKSACTDDSCAKGWCKNIPSGLECCTSDTACTGGTPCKPMKCLEGACIATPVNCDDGLDCTVDFCDVDGSCGHKPAATQCVIDGACWSVGGAHPSAAACASCDPGKSQTTWSVSGNACLIDGKCVAGGAAHPVNACQSCDSKTPLGWTTQAGTCLIDGACHAAGESLNFGCALCDPTQSTAAWTPQTGKACDDGQVCTTATTCTAGGLCTGAAKPNCCTANSDCPAGGNLAPCTANLCTVATGTCAIQSIAGCCTDGVCCNIAGQKVQPVGTACGSKFDVEYKCDGVTSYKRDLFYGCNGTDAKKCSSSTPGYGAWNVDKTCSDGAVCVLQAGQTACVVP